MSESHLTFRTGAPDDASTMAAYHRRCWVDSFTDLLESGVVAAMDPHHGADRWPLFLDPARGFTTIVADDGGRAVGHVTVRGNEVVQLFIDPDHQGRGLGRHLLEIGEALIAGAGFDTAELDTIVGNAPAIAFYEAAGWTVTDRIVHNDADGVVFDEHVLTKNLERPDQQPD
ncbi:N-acetyltransferase family protein [Ilumatobacter sp.]|uniref:GNAT family N-acetyltransferase n=1 Tax=Ilumatobacter sp. TaxID=1967498 RepID=UPI003C45E936